MSRPSKTIDPDVGSISFMIVRPSVVFPQPDSPTTPSVSPGFTESVTPSTARTCPTVRLKTARPDREVLDEVVDAKQVVPVRRRRWAPRVSGAAVSVSLISRPRPRSERARSRAPRRSGRPTGGRRLLRPCAARESRSGRRRVPASATQRGWNAQPGGGFSRLGGCPGIGSRRARSESTRARLFMSPIVYGMPRRLEDREDVADLHDAARVHDDHAVGELRDEPEVVGDEDDRRVRLLLGRLDHLDDLRLDRHVERRRRLVGDEDRSGCWPSPSRSSRAGASLPRTRAGTDRRGARRTGRRRCSEARSRARAPLSPSCRRCA